jgi:hypothetical protein
MREFHERDAQEDIGTGIDSGVDDPERHVGDSRRPDRAIAQDAETRIAFALAYYERVAIEYAACGQGNAVPPSEEGRRSPDATDAESGRASRPAGHSADSRDETHGGDQPQREGKAGTAARDATLLPSTQDLPDARDVLPNIQMAELDGRKLSDYSLNPEHPGNNGKAEGWRALGYDVDTPEGRRDAVEELRGMICEELLARGKVTESRDTAYGPSHRVLSDLTGPNGRHANLVTCWLIEDRDGLDVPRLTTTWVQPHRVKETEQ